MPERARKNSKTGRRQQITGPPRGARDLHYCGYVIWSPQQEQHMLVFCSWK